MIKGPRGPVFKVSSFSVKERLNDGFSSNIGSIPPFKIIRKSFALRENDSVTKPSGFNFFLVAGTKVVNFLKHIVFLNEDDNIVIQLCQRTIQMICGMLKCV